jgi:hypothetical protein
VTTLVQIEGTWGGAWTCDPDFQAFLTANDFKPIRFQGWSCDVDGLPNPLDNGNSDWVAGGYALGYKLEQMPYEQRNILCHSHGLGPVLYQATIYGIPVRRVLSVCSPPRKEFRDMAKDARLKIGRWRHIYSNSWDFWARAGQAFDGSWGWERNIPGAHENVGEPSIGHSGIFTAEHRNKFKDSGHFDFLHAAGSISRSHMHVV